MHQARVVALDEAWRIAIAAQQVVEFRAGDARQDGRVGDLVAIQVQDRQHRAIARRVEEFVRMP